MNKTVQSEWGERLVRGWGEGWFEAANRIGGKIGQLIGAATMRSSWPIRHR
jgi:kynureninase